MYAASAISRHFPWGSPSPTSYRTIAPSSRAAASWARAPPICPAPINAIFFRSMLISLSHIPDQGVGKFGALEERRPLHQPFEVIGDPFLADGLVNRAHYQVRRVLPPHEF